MEDEAGSLSNGMVQMVHPHKRRRYDPSEPLWLKCFSVALFTHDREFLNNGNKTIMPASILTKISSINAKSAITFKIRNPVNSLHTHCGVNEFIAPEGHIYVPYWIMQQLRLEEGQLISLYESCPLKGTFVKFMPQDNNFNRLPDAKSAFEKALKMYVCISTGDQIDLNCDGLVVRCKVANTVPTKTICIIDCDVEVEFDLTETPQALVESAEQSLDNQIDYVFTSVDSYSTSQGKQVPFCGEGKVLNEDIFVYEPRKVDASIIVPDLRWKVGALHFWHERMPVKKAEDTSQATQDAGGNEHKPFQGDGRSLR